MPQVHIIRHGQSLANIDAWANHNVIDCYLSRAGQIQAQTLADEYSERFRDKKVWIIVSPLRRAQETAGPLIERIEPICHSIIIDISPLCREQVNHKSDMLEGEVLTVETVDMLRERCQKFKNYVTQNYSKYDDVIIISHSRFIQFLLHNDYSPVPGNAVPMIVEW